MSFRTSAKSGWLLIVPLAAAVVACADLEPLLGTRANPEGPSTLRPKDIKKVSSKASVMLDKNCPDMVQPYRLTDNVASLGQIKIGETIEAWGRRLPDLIRGRAPRTTAKTDDWASIKDGAKQLNWLPMSAEVRYGEELHKEETKVLDRESKFGKKHYPLADGMLREILASVDQESDYDFQLFILKNSTRNAVAKPGGFLYLDQGLIDKPARHPKAYFALAHEVAHVLQRHETQALQNMVVDSVSDADDFMALATRVEGDPDAILRYVKTGKDVFIRYHIDQELQADSCAARMLNGAFRDHKSLVQSLKAFIEDLAPPDAAKPHKRSSSRVKGGEALGYIVNSPIDQHPNSLERKRNLQQIYAEISKETRAGGKGK